MTDKNASPQAQAEEPEIIAMFQKTSYGDYPQIKWKDGYFAKIGDSFITLPSHREAMAKEQRNVKALKASINALEELCDKKDAALKVCVETLKKGRTYVKSFGSMSLLADYDDSITQAQGALNDMG